MSRADVDEKRIALEKDWRRSFVKVGLGALVGVVALYEYAIRYPAPDIFGGHHDPEAAAQELEHLEFASEIAKAREEAHAAPTLGEIKKEFKNKWAEGARSLLCSGCKLTAAQIGEELGSRNASGQPDPGALLKVMHEAVDASCRDLPSPIVIVAGRKGASLFEVHEADHGEELSIIEKRRSDVALKGVRRLCEAILADAKLPMLETLIRHKVPHALKHGPGEAGNDNWERWLCARRARLCKRSEVTEDDEEEDEEGEL
mmetsp:Transcript_14269/g.42552  ORF Transcript_14269/g.42552 Transcript_14269/m.42552 type:complete len:259 (-) Transcript_14269:6-782(-)